MTDSVGRSVPPGFILDSCKCIERLLREKGITVAVEPEALRRLRSGRPTAEDRELMNVLLEDLSSVSQQCGNLVHNHDQAAFLILCWWITRNGSWQELLADSAPQLSQLQSAASCTSMESDAITQTADADVVSMKYRTIVQMLNQYHELDRSRVLIFKDIHQILTGIAKLPEAAGATSSTADGADTKAEFSLSHSALARLLDNLWTAATLLDSSRASAPVSSSGKQSGAAATSRSFGGGTVSSGMASAKRGSGSVHHHQRIAGAELLRTEHDALRQWCSEAQQYAASEAAFLKWASAAAEPELLRTARPPAPPAATPAQSAGSCDAKPPPSPFPQGLPGAAGTGGNSGTVDNTTEGAHAEELDKIVHKSIPMMGELEQCMLELAELGALDFDEICAVSSAIDSGYDDLGLTVEEIDEYFKSQEISGRISSHAHQFEDCDVDRIEEGEVNLFELLESECGVDWRSAGTGGAGDPRRDVGNAQRRLLQQQLRLPVLPAQCELEALRQLHEHTLRRTAKACEKFSPFEMVWSKEAQKQK